jgi:hypothetical protein
LPRSVQAAQQASQSARRARSASGSPPTLSISKEVCQPAPRFSQVFPRIVLPREAANAAVALHREPAETMRRGKKTRKKHSKDEKNQIHQSTTSNSRSKAEYSFRKTRRHQRRANTGVTNERRNYLRSAVSPETAIASHGS